MPRSIPVYDIRLKCNTCGVNLRHVTDSGRQYTKCEECLRVERRKYYKPARVDIMEQPNGAQQTAAEEASTEDQRALTPAAPGDTSPETRLQGPEEVEPGAETWAVLTSLALFADKAGRLVQHGAADNITVSADVPTGVTFGLSVGRTADHA